VFSFNLGSQNSAQSMSSTAGRINSKAGCKARYGYAKDQAAKEVNDW
jgi:hypothetical protein